MIKHSNLETKIMQRNSIIIRIMTDSFSKFKFKILRMIMLK